MVVCSPWNMSYSGGVSWYAHVCACKGLVSAKGLVHVLSYGTRVLTNQRNRGSKVQGAAETVIVGKRRQNSGVDVGWSAARTVTPTTREERGTHQGCTATTAKSLEPGKMAELWAFCAWGVFPWTWNAIVEWGSERERWLVHSLCSLGTHWAWGTVDAVRGECEAFMWVPGGVGPTVSERNSKIALEAKSKRVACQGSLEGIQGGFCAARNLG
uniref:Uncharacterized protein n=1 Tax=Oryza punctata TaxID=4537 RepID=A0A0E0LEI9_ORYPU